MTASLLVNCVAKLPLMIPLTQIKNFFLHLRHTWNLWTKSTWSFLFFTAVRKTTEDESGHYTRRTIRKQNKYFDKASLISCLFKIWPVISLNCYGLFLEYRYRQKWRLTPCHRGFWEEWATPLITPAIRNVSWEDSQDFDQDRLMTKPDCTCEEVTHTQQRI